MKSIIALSVFMSLLFYANGQYSTEIIDTTKRWSIANQP